MHLGAFWGRASLYSIIIAVFDCTRHGKWNRDYETYNQHGNPDRDGSLSHPDNQ